jgi:hypothetical protein
MTDRELLEAAAKAAKYDFIEKRFPLFPSAYEFYLRSRHPARTSDYPTLWNPLTSDADALRLMVKLELHVICNPVLTDVAFIREIDGEKIIESFIQMTSKTDPYESTRRAIVRAAAEIGRSMK